MSIFRVVLLSFIFVASANASEKKIAKSAAAKLFWAAKWMETHDRWKDVSELLRELQELDLNNDHCRARINALKQYVDGESRRRKDDARLDTSSFLEARLVLMDCITEFRPRFNHSWSDEVRSVQAMIKTAIFPGHEPEGVIVFPEPHTYSFDLYGYTVRNIKALMIHRGGVELEPLFKELLVDLKREAPKKPKANKEDIEEDFGNYMYIRKIEETKDKVYSYLWREGFDAEIGGWDPARTEGKKKDDIDFGKVPGGDTIKSLADVYKYLKDMLVLLKNQRSIDEYEPLMLLWLAVTNPKLIEHDPQLRAFVSGVRLKYKLAEEGKDVVKFEPHDYKLVELVNDALVPDAKVKLHFEVDNKTAREALYVISNFNGDTNIYSNILTFKNVIRTVQGAKYMPEGMAAWIKAMPQNLPKYPGKLASWLDTMSKSHNIIYKAMGTVGHPVVNMTVGRQIVTQTLEGTGKFIERVAARPSARKALAAVKSEFFLRTLVAVSVGADLTTGILKMVYAGDNDDIPEILIHTGAEVGGTLLYLVKSKRVVRGVIALDIGHMLFDKVPSTSQLLEAGALKLYNGFVEWDTGKTPLEHRLLKIKRQLGIGEGNDDAVTLLRAFESEIAAASTTLELEKAWDKMTEALGDFSARRLTFHYVAVTALNGKGSRSLGEMLRDHYEQYDRMVNWTWFEAPGSSKPRQLGLKELMKDFDKKWVRLGGTLPRKPSVFGEL